MFLVELDESAIRISRRFIIPVYIIDFIMAFILSNERITPLLKRIILQLRVFKEVYSTDLCESTC